MVPELRKATPVRLRSVGLMEPAIVTVSFAFDIAEFVRAERAVIRAVRGPWWTRWENVLWLVMLAYLMATSIYMVNDFLVSRQFPFWP